MYKPIQGEQGASQGGWIVITFVNFTAKISYPADCSSMAGGKETWEVLPRALVHIQVSRDLQYGYKHKHEN